jgi:hypothetical protein
MPSNEATRVFPSSHNGHQVSHPIRMWFSILSRGAGRAQLSQQSSTCAEPREKRLATPNPHLMDQNIEPCYTCRNRRIQCDQSSVPCAKCQKAGLECFDKRPFRWVKGVAIRGKMQGRSFTGNASNNDKKSALISIRQSMVQCRHGQTGKLDFNSKYDADEARAQKNFVNELYLLRILYRFYP